MLQLISGEYRGKEAFIDRDMQMLSIELDAGRVVPILLSIRNLEEKVMSMAVAAKELIEGNLKYLDGTPVQCVIADTTISGSAQARDCAEKFSKENVTATLSVTSCWCYGSETMDTDLIP